MLLLVQIFIVSRLKYLNFILDPVLEFIIVDIMVVKSTSHNFVIFTPLISDVNKVAFL